MKKIILVGLVLAIMYALSARADDSGIPERPMAATVSIFSTSTNWEGLTGLQLSEYRGDFIPDSDLIGSKGLILYYLDSFPCYGLGFGVRVWLGPRNKSEGTLNIACIYPPSEIKFAYRNAARDADQAETKGILTCPVSGNRELEIDLSKCVKGEDWRDRK